MWKEFQYVISLEGRGLKGLELKPSVAMFCCVVALRTESR